MNRKKVIRLVGVIIALPFILAVLFLLAAWIGSSIPRNSAWQEPESGIEIIIGDNGVHTEIVMPLTNAVKDWREEFPASDIQSPWRPYTHVAVSWGEREVFLNTPTWADLKLSVALNAAVGGDGLLHVAHYVRPAPSTAYRPLRISTEQYAQLVESIEAEILPADQREKYAGYTSNDVFYDAPGTYHLGNTCNQWVGDVLAGAGIRMGLWTPMSGGVMKWIPEPEAR